MGMNPLLFVVEHLVSVRLNHSEMYLIGPLLEYHQMHQVWLRLPNQNHSSQLIRYQNRNKHLKNQFVEHVLVLVTFLQ